MGIYIVTQLLTNSLEERFATRMHEATLVAGDSVVRQEEANLEVLRVMVFTVGIDEALLDNDVETLRQYLEGLTANAQLDSVIVSNTDGLEILNLQSVSGPGDTNIYESNA